jgi:hypothetical protein
MSATLQQSTEAVVVKKKNGNLKPSDKQPCVCFQRPSTTFYLFISILIFKLHLFVSFPRERFTRQFRRNKYVQISFLQHDSQFFIFTNIWSYIVEAGNIQITEYSLLFK